MRRHRYKPYDVNVAPANPGEFTLEFSVETKANEPHTRVCMTMPRFWTEVLVDKVMEVVRKEETAIASLRQGIKAEANR